MIIKKLSTFYVIFFVVFGFSFFCHAQQQPIPEFYGFYIVANGELTELESQEIGYTITRMGKGTELKYTGFDVNDPNLYFIFFEKDLTFLSGTFELYKLKWVKMYMQWKISSSYNQPPETVRELNRWVVTNIMFKLRRKPIEKREDVVILVPEAPLKPGVYAVGFKNSYCVFSVNFDSYDKDAEALDRITPPGWEGWSRDIYVPHGKYGGRYSLHSSSSRSSRGVTRQSIHAVQKNGMIQIRNANYYRAEQYFRRALEIKEAGLRTDNAKSHFGLGLALAYQHKFDEAKKSFEIAIEMVPNLSDAYYSLASIYSLQGKKDLAIFNLEMALKKGFNNYEFIQNDTDLDYIRNDPRFKKLIEGKK